MTARIGADEGLLVDLDAFAFVGLRIDLDVFELAMTDLFRVFPCLPLNILPVLLNTTYAALGAVSGRKTGEVEGLYVPAVAVVSKNTGDVEGLTEPLNGMTA